MITMAAVSPTHVCRDCGNEYASSTYDRTVRCPSCLADRAQTKQLHSGTFAHVEMIVVDGRQISARSIEDAQRIVDSLTSGIKITDMQSKRGERIFHGDLSAELQARLQRETYVAFVGPQGEVGF